MKDFQGEEEIILGIHNHNNITHVFLKPIYMYSFSIRPEEHQPSGTLNFSRLSDVRAKFFMSKVSPID